MAEFSQLVSLVQQQISDTSQSSGKTYKMFGSIEKEFDVSLEGYTDFMSNLLPLLKRCNMKYLQEKDVAFRDKIAFNPINYGLTLCEKITTHLTPINIRLNLEFFNKDSDVLYHDIFIYKCIEMLQNIILGVFNVDIAEDICRETMCFVLESDPWIVEDKQNIRLNFMFPFARVNIEHLNRAVIYHFRKQLLEENIFKEYFTQTPIGDLNKIVPDADIYLPLYGCRMSSYEAPLMLRGVYSHINDLPDIQDIDDESKLPFYINYYESPYTDPLLNSLVTDRFIDKGALNNDRIENLPLILSAFFSSGLLKINPDISLSQTELKQPEPKYESRVNCTYDKFTKLAELIPMVSRSRTTEYYKYYWYTIGKALHNIYSGTQYGLVAFENVTSDPVLKTECAEIYSKFHNEILDIRTIEEFAKQDSPDQYKLWKKQQFWHKMVDIVSLATLNVAEPIAEYFSLTFVYDRLNKEWYHFTGNRCKRDVDALEFIKAIREDFTKFLYEYRDELSSKSMGENSRAGKKYYEDQIKEIVKAILKFSDLNFLKKIVEACTVFMFDDNLYIKTDEDPNLTGCLDGVIECFDNNITFRPGKLQDYITKSTNIRFPSCFDWNDTKVLFVRKYYSQVHTDAALNHFFMKWMASILKSGNDEKYFINWIGSSNNSKSQVLKFLQLALGDYCVPFPNHLITVNINSNSGRPEPALEKAKGAKLAVVAETDVTEILHVGQIKKFTGNDTYVCRTLNKEGGERTLTFKLVHMSNVICGVSNPDEGYNIREVIIPFLSKWVDNAPSDEMEQYRQRLFQIDLDFSANIRYYAQAQLWLMFMYYPTYRQEKIRILPDVVKRITCQHHLDIDVLYNFQKDRLDFKWIGDSKDRIPDKTVKCTTFDLHQIYKRWIRLCYSNKVEPLDYIKFGNELSKKIGEQENGYWYGVTPRQEVAAGGI